MITQELKKDVSRQLNANDYWTMYGYSLCTYNNNHFDLLRGYSCKQELCHKIYSNEQISSYWVLFNSIQNKAKFKANLNKIESLLNVPVGKLCFITTQKGKVSLLFSHKSFWAQSLLLFDLFCLLIRSANTELDIEKIDDIFKANHGLASHPSFLNIISNFEEFKNAALNSTEKFYERNLYGRYGVLEFSKELIKVP